jgi:hypothetical protein
MENLLSATILFILDECLTKETMKSGDTAWSRPSARLQRGVLRLQWN